MIKEVTMYTVICDNCGQDAFEDEDASCCGDKIFAVEWAEECGFHTIHPGDNLRAELERLKAENEEKDKRIEALIDNHGITKAKISQIAAEKTVEELNAEIEKLKSEMDQFAIGFVRHYIHESPWAANFEEELEKYKASLPK